MTAVAQNLRLPPTVLSTGKIGDKRHKPVKTSQIRNIGNVISPVLRQAAAHRQEFPGQDRFFYLIAGAASLFALIGWQSLKEIKDNTKQMADQQLRDIAEQYEKKFQLLERDLKRKTRIIAQNNKEIEIINEVHNLWLRSQSAQTPEQKIEVYDEILRIRPGDLEALTHKADAAMAR